MDPRTYIGSSYGQGQPGGLRGFAFGELGHCPSSIGPRSGNFWKFLEMFGHKGAFYLKVGAARDHTVTATCKKSASAFTEFVVYCNCTLLTHTAIVHVCS